MSLQLDTLCLRGDNPAAITLVKQLSRLLA